MHQLKILITIRLRSQFVSFLFQRQIGVQLLDKTGSTFIYLIHCNYFVFFQWRTRASIECILLLFRWIIFTKKNKNKNARFSPRKFCASLPTSRWYTVFACEWYKWNDFHFKIESQPFFQKINKSFETQFCATVCVCTDERWRWEYYILLSENFANELYRKPIDSQCSRLVQFLFAYTQIRKEINER